MVIIVKKDTREERIRDLIQWIESQNLRTHVSTGDYSTIIGVIGDTTKLDEDLISGLDIVEGVKRVSEPFKSANRKFHPKDSVIEVGAEHLKVGHGNFALIAGPCSVESEEQIISVARSVKAAGATMLRGGAFKPRTSPYDFQGLKADGIELLLEAKRETGLPIVTEIMNANHLPLFEDVDVIQVGARNMQNFELLKELGRTNKPILIKRGLFPFLGRGLSQGLQGELDRKRPCLAGQGYGVRACLHPSSCPVQAGLERTSGCQPHGRTAGDPRQQPGNRRGAPLRRRHGEIRKRSGLAPDHG